MATPGTRLSLTRSSSTRSRSTRRRTRARVRRVRRRGATRAGPADRPGGGGVDRGGTAGCRVIRGGGPSRHPLRAERPGIPGGDAARVPRRQGLPGRPSGGDDHGGGRGRRDGGSDGGCDASRDRARRPREVSDLRRGHPRVRSPLRRLRPGGPGPAGSEPKQLIHHFIAPCAAPAQRQSEVTLRALGALPPSPVQRPQDGKQVQQRLPVGPYTHAHRPYPNSSATSPGRWRQSRGSRSTAPAST